VSNNSAIVVYKDRMLKNAELQREWAN